MRGLTFVSGAAVGAGLMYLLDPDRGEDRRADLRDTLAELGESELVERAVARARQLEPLVERARKLEPLAAMRGLDVNAMVDRPARALERSGMLEAPARWWAKASKRPEVRRGAELFGLRLRRRRGPAAGDWALIGGLLGATIVGLWLGRRAMASRDEMELVRSITIEGPVERVYEFWNDFENFPRFMSHVREVRRIGLDRTRWVVAGPAGAPVEWEAIVTERRPNELISWRTVEGSVIDHRGAVRFRPAGPNATRVEVRMTYKPLGGAMGRTVASLLGSDPARVIDEDLARLASHLRGQRSAVGEGPWR
jgi:uncharacterized membrane protein